MRKEYKFTSEELKDLLVARFPQQYNAFWQRLAKKRGFLWETVRPSDERGYKYFTAVRA